MLYHLQEMGHKIGDLAQLPTQLFLNTPSCLGVVLGYVVRGQRWWGSWGRYVLGLGLQSEHVLQICDLLSVFPKLYIL